MIVALHGYRQTHSLEEWEMWAAVRHAEARVRDLQARLDAFEARIAEMRHFVAATHVADRSPVDAALAGTRVPVAAHPQRRARLRLALDLARSAVRTH